MTREPSCRTKVSQNPEEYKTVKDVNCKGLKPKVLLRACYKEACLAEWVPSPWGKVKKKFLRNIYINGFRVFVLYVLFSVYEKT